MADTTTPAIRVDMVPATLHSQNSIDVFCFGLYQWDIYRLLWNEENGSPTQIEFEINTIPPEVHYSLKPTIPGASYTFKVQGCSQGLFGGRCSEWSDPVTATAVQNSSSMRPFLARSGIDESKDVSIRGLIPGNMQISIRNLLSGL